MNTGDQNKYALKTDKHEIQQSRFNILPTQIKCMTHSIMCVFLTV